MLVSLYAILNLGPMPWIMTLAQRSQTDADIIINGPLALDYARPLWTARVQHEFDIMTMLAMLQKTRA